MAWTRSVLGVLVSGTVIGACASFAAESAPTATGPTMDATDESRSDADVGGEGGSAYRDMILADGPIAYYRLGERSGTAARDERGQHDGVYGGDISLGAPGAVAGDTDLAVAFDGGHVDLGDAFDFGGGEPFTLELWVRPTTPGTGTLFAKIVYEDGGARQGYFLQLDGALANKVTFAFFATDGGVVYANSSAPPALDTFTHVVATYDGGQGRIFFDGVETALANLPPTLPNTSAHLTIGARPFAPAGLTNPLSGTIDEVAIYNRVLSDTRIQAHAAARR